MDEATREALTAYVRILFAPEDALLREIKAETERQDIPLMNIRPEEGRMLQFLAAAIGAKKIVEVGTLAGYSGVWLGRTLPPDGKLYTLDINEKRAGVARKFFEEASLGERVEQRVGDAHEALKALSGEGPFDLMFIDAEKEGYPVYLEWGLANVRPGGLILAHNAFWHGRVIDPDYDDHAGAQGLRAYNRAIAEDERLLSTIIPVGDGIAATVVRG